MYFNDLSLAGWSYEKGDLQITLRDHITDKRILSRNPVEHTFVYEDEDEWRERLQYHCKTSAISSLVFATLVHGLLHQLLTT